MEAIKYYVKGAFVGIAETPEVLEQQEELIADMQAKVADLVADGRSENEALGMAIASMGDLSGLVREFAVEADAAAAPAAEPVTTAEVYSSRLRLHVVAISAGLTIGALFVLSLLAAMAGAANGSALLWDLVIGGAAVAWVGYTLRAFHQDPDAVETMEIPGAKQLLRAVLQWMAFCVAALIFNLIADNAGFWAWTLWLAGAAWPGSLYVQQRLIDAGRFLHPRVEATSPVEASATAASCA